MAKYFYVATWQSEMCGAKLLKNGILHIENFTETTIQEIQDRIKKQRNLFSFFITTLNKVED